MKYLGGKGKIAHEIASEFNKVILLHNINNYYEPFCGGCAVIQLVEAQHRYASDANKYLIAFIEYLMAGGELPEDSSKEEYYRVKENPDAYPDWYVFLYASVLSYKAKWWGGYGSEYFYQRDQKVIDRLEQFKNGRMSKSGLGNYRDEMNRLRGTTISYKDYKTVKIEPGSLVYCDIPYKSTISYPFGDFNHNEFYDWACHMAKESLIYISEYMMPMNRFKEVKSIEMYSDIGDDDKDRIEKLYCVKGGWLVDELYGEDTSGYNINF